MRLLAEQAIESWVDDYGLGFDFYARGDMRENAQASIVEFSLLRILQHRVGSVEQRCGLGVATAIRVTALSLHQASITCANDTQRGVTFDAKQGIVVLFLFDHATQTVVSPCVSTRKSNQCDR